MKPKIQFVIITLNVIGVDLAVSGIGIYTKPRGATLGEWQASTGLMFYPMVGWTRL